MKAIKPMVYEALTPKQRVIATLEAEARDDQAEVRRLVETCPKVTYRANDERYSGTMRGIVNIPGDGAARDRPGRHLRHGHGQ